MRNRIMKDCWLPVIFILLLLSAGCGAGQTMLATTAISSETPEPTAETESALTAQKTYYVTGYNEVSYQDGNRYEFQCTAPDGYYATRNEITGTDIDDDGETKEVISTCLYYIAEDGTAQKLKDFEPLSFETAADEEFSIEGFSADSAGNLIVLEEEFRCWSEAPEGTIKYSQAWYDQYVQVEQYYIRRLDKNGKEISRAYLQDPSGTGYIYLHDPVLLSADQVLVACDGTGICAYDMEGNIEYVIPLDGVVESLTVMGSEEAAALVRTENGKQIALFNTQTKTQENVCILPDTAYGIVCGTGEYDFYYTDNGSFYGGTFRGTESRILRWLDCGIDSGFIADCRVNTDKTIVCLTEEWSEKFRDSRTGVITLEMMSPEEAGITDITLGTLDTNRSLNNLIIDYNCSGAGSRIILRDYSQYGEMAAIRLRSDLMDADSPDLLDLSGLDEQTLAKAGLLKNLLPYLQTEHITLVDSAERAEKIDDALFVAVKEFQVNLILSAEPTENNTDTQNMKIQIPITIASGDDLLRITAIANGKTELDGYTFKLNVSEATVSTSAVSLAMCSASDNKDGAWQLLRNYFTEEYQSKNSTAFPTNQKLFDALLLRLQEPGDKTGSDESVVEDSGEVQGEKAAEGNNTAEPDAEDVQTPLYTITYGETTIEVAPLTKEQAAMWENLIETADAAITETEGTADADRTQSEATQRLQEMKDRLTELIYEVLNSSTDQ